MPQSLDQIFQDKRTKATRFCCSKTAVIHFEDQPSTILHAGRVRCKSWFCPECSKRELKILRGRLHAFTQQDRFRLLTLTTRDTSQDRIESIKTIAHAWDMLAKRIRRKYGKIKYFRVIQFHENGLPHMHVLINKWVSQKWLSIVWQELWQSHIVDIRMPDAHRVVGYVTRYISRELKANEPYQVMFAIAHVRRYSFSRGAPKRGINIKTNVLWCGRVMWDNPSELIHHLIELHVFRERPLWIYADDTDNLLIALSAPP